MASRRRRVAAAGAALHHRCDAFATVLHLTSDARKAKGYIAKLGGLWQNLRRLNSTLPLHVLLSGGATTNLSMIAELQKNGVRYGLYNRDRE